MCHVFTRRGRSYRGRTSFCCFGAATLPGPCAWVHMHGGGGGSAGELAGKAQIDRSGPVAGIHASQSGRNVSHSVVKLLNQYSDKSEPGTERCNLDSKIDRFWPSKSGTMPPNFRFYRKQRAPGEFFSQPIEATSDPRAYQHAAIACGEYLKKSETPVGRSQSS